MPPGPLGINNYCKFLKGLCFESFARWHRVQALIGYFIFGFFLSQSLNRFYSHLDLRPLMGDLGRLNQGYKIEISVVYGSKPPRPLFFVCLFFF